jgi:hypothetical protein
VRPTQYQAAKLVGSPSAPATGLTLLPAVLAAVDNRCASSWSAAPADATCHRGQPATMSPSPDVALITSVSSCRSARCAWESSVWHTTGASYPRVARRHGRTVRCRCASFGRRPPRSSMTVNRTENPRPNTPADEPPRAALSLVQVAASALAAVSAAVVASFFGLAGTLIGAGLASVISTVSATLYSSSLQRTRQRLLQARTQFAGPPPSPASRPAARSTGGGLPRALDPRRPLARRRPRQWSRAGVGAAAVFLVAMGIVTGIELIGQRPVSALVGASHTSRVTTIGALTDGSGKAGHAPSTPSKASASPAPSIPPSSPSAQPSATANRPPDSATPSATESASTSASMPGTPAQPTTSTVGTPSATPTRPASSTASATRAP